eukprot:comp22604_c0_seq1/m.34676 comp22604_c0_seq1/g.34676  ORF comp22604_c0_seq1/g.34676 comp22604_c0_seq1/m.34676 type:complete len:542 (-) comp22604_c0_seq1:2-1627(-)
MKKEVKKEVVEKVAKNGRGGGKKRVAESEESEGEEEERPKKSSKKTKMADEPLGPGPAGKVDERRARLLTKVDRVADECRGIVYWMSRDQRADDNWALLLAQEKALALGVPLHVVFNLVPKFLEATIRQYGFMIKGLQETEKVLREKNINFHLLMGDPLETVPAFVQMHKMGALVADFSPLRIGLLWHTKVAETFQGLGVPMWQVDAHNVVPCWVASNKLEYGARTIRPKITKLLPVFLTDFPALKKHSHSAEKIPEPVDWKFALASLQIDRTVPEVEWAKAGAKGGRAVLDDFIEKRLKLFETKRNDPNTQALSNLSPWLHFGQISAQRCALEVKAKGSKHSGSVASFLEESIVRRELADNFCFYNDKYDSIDCAYDWARTTLEIHSKDKREFVYTLKELEDGLTHDDLWNAAQLQTVKDAKMHGFLRMYWAKKILEWTSSPQEALKYAIYLNDKYNLDGRDPNGYVGCAWSICGIHDQGWAERSVFGKIRYMNYDGCKRKFDVAGFVRKYPSKPTAAKEAKQRALQAGGATWAKGSNYK